MLVDDPVKRVDNMTMAWGLEARVPFLDHELVELAARIPPEHKLREGGKGVLKDVGRRMLPAEVIDRPKGYFPVPALKYIEGPYLDMVRDVLHSRRTRERGLFREEYVEKLLRDPKDHITPLRGSKLWQVAVLEMWLQANNIGETHRKSHRERRHGNQRIAVDEFGPEDARARRNARVAAAMGRAPARRAPAGGCRGLRLG